MIQSKDDRNLMEFPKLTHGLRSKARKIGVEKLPARKRQERELLVLGSGRCGTTTVAKIFQKMEYDLQHERVGSYGTSSLYFNVDSAWSPQWPWYPGRIHVGERRSDFIFKHVLHVVRHPAKVIPSMGAVFPSLNYEYFEDNDIVPKGLKSQLHRCAYAYHALNKLSEEQSEYRFQIEQLDSLKVQKDIACVLKISAGHVPFPELPVANRATGFRKRDPLDWSKLYELDKELCKRIQSMATRYGYTL